MIRHLVVMSSSYSTGTRIALDYTGTDLTVPFITQQLEKIKSICGNEVSLSTHFIYAKSEAWEDVIAADSYFENVDCVDSIDKFIGLIKRDLTLSGLDVAKYILSQKACTHLKLEKLTYLCYADYLCDYNDKLFNDKILAYTYGPVVESVYKNYRGKGYAVLEEDDKINIESTKKMPAQSRILFALNGVQKLRSIDITLLNYGDFSAIDLVRITHRNNSPWNNTPQSNEITDTIIKSNHCNELLC